MSAESVASPTPESSETRSSFAGQVDVAHLDDKHLWLYRHPNERRALIAIVIGLVAITGVLWLAWPVLGGMLEVLPAPILRFLSQWVQPTRIGLFIVGLLLVMAIMDIVGQSTRAGQLVAQAVEITPTTFPALAPIADDLRTRFDLPRTRVYVSRDAPLTGYTIGVREPFAIVFSSIGVGSLTPDEFKFTLGREMGSIKLGHTVMAMLLGNVRMSLPQPFSMLLKFRSILFSTYHHAQALSCDRIGVIATRDIRPALSTLVKQNLGAVRGAKIDFNSLAPQAAEMSKGFRGAAFRATMVFNPQPFAVARLSELVTWAGEPESAVAETPATPSRPTPAASAAAAAKSAAAAAKSAAEAAASAAAVAALLARSEAGESVPPNIEDRPVVAEPVGVATSAGSSQAADALSVGAASTASPSTPATQTSPSAVAEAAPALITPTEKSTVAEPVATSTLATDLTGSAATTSPPAAAPEGESVSVADPQPPHREGREPGGTA